MSQIQVVEAVQGKYGPQVKDSEGVYYSFSKFYKGDTELAPGTYDVELYTTAKGNQYINSAELVGEASEAPAKKPGKKAKTKVSESTTPPPPSSPGGRDFNLEAFGKIKSLFLQSLMPILVTNPNDEALVKATVRKWALYAMVDDRTV